MNPRIGFVPTPGSQKKVTTNVLDNNAEPLGSGGGATASGAGDDDPGTGGDGDRPLRSAGVQDRRTDVFPAFERDVDLPAAVVDPGGSHVRRSV